MALMAFSDSQVTNDKSCTKTCLKNYETLKKQCDELIVKLNQIEFTTTTYKRGLATVEEQLVTYKKNEVLLVKKLQCGHHSRRINSKFLRSLPPEWNTHVVVWMNKDDIETMSIDNLYNNFKIIKQGVKKSIGTSTGAQNMAFMTAPSTSSTNDVNTVNPTYKASTVSHNVNIASPQHDLEQIHEDDLEAIDLRWQLSLLSMRAKRRTSLDKHGSNGVFRLSATYNRGLATVEEQLVTYKKNEVLLVKKLQFLKEK
nr:hypothetical protein [Tanacetum cinerariifolium]